MNELAPPSPNWYPPWLATRPSSASCIFRPVAAKDHFLCWLMCMADRTAEALIQDSDPVRARKPLRRCHAQDCQSWHHGSSKAFQNDVYGKLGQVDLGDQAALAASVSQLVDIDADRVGIYGFSYGGYMSALGLTSTQMFSASACLVRQLSIGGTTTPFTPRDTWVCCLRMRPATTPAHA